jgi:hypothetical protein
MSSKPNSNESTETEAVRTRTAESPDGNSAQEEIRGRAHEIYLERGGQPVQIVGGCRPLRAYCEVRAYLVRRRAVGNPSGPREDLSPQRRPGLGPRSESAFSLNWITSCLLTISQSERIYL